MGKINDGGPAFPLHPGVLPEWSGSAGMSLRDWFAGQALSGFLADPNVDAGYALIAVAAFDMADAMLAARAEGGAE